jgi:hypothetical protein
MAPIDASALLQGRSPRPLAHDQRRRKGGAIGNWRTRQDSNL